MAGFLRLGEASLTLTRTSLDDFARFARSAEGELLGEVFVMSHAPTAGVVKEVGARGVTQRYVLDPEYGPKVLDTLGAVDGLSTSTYGAMPAKNHAKLFHTGDRSLLMTGAFTDRTTQRIEGVVQLTGETSAAAREVTEAAFSGDVKRMRRAVRAAEQLGVVLNDAISGEQLLTKRLHALIDTTQHELTISTKIYTDPGIRTAVQRAVKRGVEVKFTDIRGGGMHATLVAGDNQVYVGSAHLSPRAMGDGRLAYRKAREAGVFVQDAGVARTLRGQLDSMGLAVYDSDQFERTRVAYDAMDAPRQVKEQIARLEEGGDAPDLAARLADLEAKAEPARQEWRALTAEVKAARQADGIRFTPDAATQQLLDGLPAGRAGAVDQAGQAVAAGRAGAAEPAARVATRGNARRNVAIGVGVAGAAAGGTAWVATR